MLPPLSARKHRRSPSDDSSASPRTEQSPRYRRLLTGRSQVFSPILPSSNPLSRPVPGSPSPVVDELVLLFGRRPTGTLERSYSTDAEFPFHQPRPRGVEAYPRRDRRPRTPSGRTRVARRRLILRSGSCQPCRKRPGYEGGLVTQCWAFGRPRRGRFVVEWVT